MKQYKLLKHLLVLLAVALLPQVAAAYSFMVDGLCYNRNSDGTSVTVTYQTTSSPRYTDLSGDLVIPATVTYSGTTYSVTSIGQYAFWYCSGLTSVTIGNSVTSIGNWAFVNCSGLTEVTIGNSVTSIGSCAFQNCSGLTGELVIPNSVKSIGNWAFVNCSGLTGELVIPNSVTSIGESTFSGCSGLTSVTIPNSVTSIGQYAFKNCSGLTSVTIPNSVTSIGGSAFSGCNGLESMVVESGNSTYDSRDNCNAIIETASNTLVAGCKATTIPNSVTSIGNSAFLSCRGLTSVTIPNSVTSIGEGAFRDCSGLTSVTIGNSVTSIGNSAFRDCSGLTSVSIPNSVSRLGALAFYNCSGLKTVSIGTGLVTMDLSTDDVPLPVFSGCNALTSVTWNAKNCADFTSSTTPFSAANSSIKSFTIGGQVQRIPAYLCSGLTGLTSVTIPNSVTSIGSSAFDGCSGLKELTWNAINCTSMGDMPKGSIEQVTIGDGVEVLPGSFAKGSKITSVTIPNSVTSIEGSAFRDCSGLTSVTIPNSVTSIEGSAFRDCSGLTLVSIGKSVTSIGNYAFYGCSGLTEVTWNAKSCNNFGSSNSPFSSAMSSIKSFTFGEQVRTIPAYLCYQMTGLTSVTIPNSVTSIGGNAFSGCSGITEVTWNAKSCANCTPFSDAGSSINSFTIGEQVEIIPVNLCQHLSGIKKLTWNAINCSSMGDMPKGNIKQVTIGDGVEVLPNNFVQGSKITSVTIPNSVTSIGDYAFQGCSGLLLVCSKIVEPEGVQLGDNVFAGIPYATCKLNVPSGSIASYQSADQWKDFLMIVDFSYDVNLDGTIDIADVNAVVNKMLERNGAPTKELADVNRDDYVDIIDVNEVISAMLGYGNLPEPPCATQTYTVNGVSFTMIGVQGGTFTMGATAEQGSDAFDSEKPAHQVTLSNYRIGQTEVTQELWLAVMGSNPSHFTGNLQRPVECVSWDDCQTFITKLNQLTGKNFRLPTEAEWEYAARGGNQSQGYKYAGSNNVDEVAWCVNNGNSTTHTVATKAANELGIYDMSGNVLEWCQDWYGSYSSDAQTNPTGPASGSERIFRGGSYVHTNIGYNRVSCRDADDPTKRYINLGFRLVLLPEPPISTQTYTVNGVTFSMIGVNGGTFTMGATAEQGSDAFDSEKPAHQVTLSNYRIGQTEVTQELWQAVMGSNPSHFTGDLQRPVECVSWDDCQTFITKLNQLTGKNFRLPTEAEWEYAARGGNQSQGYKYAGSNNVDEVAWCVNNGNSTTHTVATKAPNELGIYDMSGNVLEWCQDWYGSYSSDAQTNPTGSASGSARIFRGGSYLHPNIGCNRVSWRYADGPTKKYINLGFRLAL